MTSDLLPDDAQRTRQSSATVDYDRVVNVGYDEDKFTELLLYAAQRLASDVAGGAPN